MIHDEEMSVLTNKSDLELADINVSVLNGTPRNNNHIIDKMHACT